MARLEVEHCYWRKILDSGASGPRQWRDPSSMIVRRTERSRVCLNDRALSSQIACVGRGMPIQVPQRPPVRQTGRTQTLDFYPLVTQRRGRMSRIMALTLAAALFASTSSALADWHGHGGGYHGGGWHGGHDHHGGCGWCWGLGLGGLALGLGTLYAAPPVYYAPRPAYYPPPGYAPGYAYPPPRLRSRPPRLGPRSGRLARQTARPILQ